MIGMMAYYHIKSSICSSSVDGHDGGVGAPREAGHGRGRQASRPARQRAPVGQGGRALPRRGRAATAAAATTTGTAAATAECIPASEQRASDWTSGIYFHPNVIFATIFLFHFK